MNIRFNKRNYHEIARDVTIVELLSAFNIASRMFLQFAPNIKPVTTVIIVTAMVLGFRYSLYINVVTVLVSGILLVFGTFIPFQILAWAIIGGLAGILHKNQLYKKIPIGFMALLCAIGGFLFGFFVSLDKFFIAGPCAFYVYYLEMDKEEQKHEKSYFYKWNNGSRENGYKPEFKKDAATFSILRWRLVLGYVTIYSYR